MLQKGPDGMRISKMTRAFPNAYLETDEPPRGLLRERGLALVSMVGTLYFGLTVLLLSLFDPDYNPISQVASDYGVGRYAFEMNVGFLIGGIGLIAFALGLARQNGRLKSRAGAGLLFVAGLILVMDSYFTTNLEGAPSTLSGTIHGFGGLIFFTTAPLGVLLTTRKQGRSRFLATLSALIVGFGLLVAGSLASLNVGGLAERIIIEAILLTVSYSSLSLA
jgi:hypothetical membrane protein